MKITPHARTVNALLETQGTDLASFLKDQRDSGLSLAKTARALFEFTGGVVDVTGETIRNWTADLERKAS